MIAGSSVTGVTINLQNGTTADPQQRVTLLNLSINGAGSCVATCIGTNTGLRGINIAHPSANGPFSTVVVENIVIQNFTQQGSRDNRTSFGGNLYVSDTTIRTAAATVGPTAAARPSSAGPPR